MVRFFSVRQNATKKHSTRHKTAYNKRRAQWQRCTHENDMVILRWQNLNLWHIPTAVYYRFLASFLHKLLHGNLQIKGSNYNQVINYSSRTIHTAVRGYYWSNFRTLGQLIKTSKFINVSKTAGQTQQNLCWWNGISCAIVGTCLHLSASDNQLLHVTNVHLQHQHNANEWLHPFTGLVSRTWVSWYQKGKTSLDLNEARDDWVWGCSGISWTICKQSAPRSRQITTSTPHRSVFTDRMLFLLPNQQHQSTEGRADIYRLAQNKHGHPALPQTPWKLHDRTEWKYCKYVLAYLLITIMCLQCFDTVGCAAGRACGL